MGEPVGMYYYWTPDVWLTNNPEVRGVRVHGEGAGGSKGGELQRDGWGIRNARVETGRS